jgi:hypothetical protein
MLGDNVSLVLVLATGFGVVIGWQIYTAVVALLLRLNKNVPLFAWREGVVSGIMLLGIAVAIMAVGVFWSASTFSRLTDAFLATIVAGAAAHQLWLCWLASRSRQL